MLSNGLCIIYENSMIVKATRGERSSFDFDIVDFKRFTDDIQKSHLKPVRRHSVSYLVFTPIMVFVIQGGLPITDGQTNSLKE